jgi:rhamnopyranosyl-N-acetylglucosaminyl-diphospho-decaprenol beta-1,3/1,4-galactofuranosyltransferase
MPDSRDVALVMVTVSCRVHAGSDTLAWAARHRHPVVVVCNDPRASEGTVVQDDVTVVHPGRNVGGAGGYRLGLATALSAGHEWLVTMDSDAEGQADDWVGTLMDVATAQGLQITAPVILANDRPGETAFPYRVDWRRTMSAERVRRQRLLPGQFHPFNGTLFHRSVFARVALPDPQFVINGEERDLYLRIVNAGIRCATVTDVVMSHPSGRGDRQPAFLGPLGAPIPSSRLKLAYQVRNRAFLTRRYRRADWVAVDVVRYSAAALARGPHRRQRWRDLSTAYVAGLRGHLGALPPDAMPAWPEGPGDAILSRVRLDAP